jgi:Zn-dependent protease
MNFYITDREAKEIAVSVFAIAIAFTIANFGLGIFSVPQQAVALVALSLATIGIGFIFHELAHKVVANFFGAAAEFRMWTQGLMLMFFVSLMGMLFAAPGAVYIYSPYITKRQNGLISLAGPATNLALTGIFLALFFIRPLPIQTGEGAVDAWIFGAMINTILGFFNMLPMFPLDGSKIIRWNFFIWIFFMAVFFGIGFLLLGPGVLVSWGMMLALAFIFSAALFGR